MVKNEKAKTMGDNIQVCFSQPKNLKRIITQKNERKHSDEEPGCFKCGRCRVSCPIMKEGNKFTSTNTQRTYPIRQLSILVLVKNVEANILEKVPPHSKSVIVITNKKSKNSMGDLVTIMAARGVATQVYQFNL